METAAATATATACEGDVTLPMSMIAEIISHLPIKEVGRLRGVSKDCLSELSSPRFITNHQKIHNKNHLIFISWSDQFIKLASLDREKGMRKFKYDSNERSMTIRGSCNGLVLLSSQGVDDNYKLTVLNPTTMKSMQLPECISSQLINDIEKDQIVYGFGYHSKTDDYKFVSIVFENPSSDTTSMHFRVCSLRDNITRARVTYSLNEYTSIVRWPGVFFNGFLHWCAKKRYNRSGVILAFNLASETFNEVPSPDFDIATDRQCKLVVVNGKLALVVRNDAWLMNDYGVKESWTKILHNGFVTFFKSLISDNEKDQNSANGYRHMVIDDTKDRRYSQTFNFYPSALKMIQDSFIESLASPNLTRIN